MLFLIPELMEFPDLSGWQFPIGVTNPGYQILSHSCPCLSVVYDLLHVFVEVVQLPFHLKLDERIVLDVLGEQFELGLVVESASGLYTFEVGVGSSKYSVLKLRI